MGEESIKSKLEDFVKHSAELSDTAIKLAKLNAVQKTAKISSNLIFTFSVLFLLLLTLLFGSIAAAWWLGNVLHSRTTGFLVIGGFYLLLLLFLLILKNKVILPWFRNMIVNKIYE